MTAGEASLWKFADQAESRLGTRRLKAVPGKAPRGRASHLKSWLLRLGSISTLIAAWGGGNGVSVPSLRLANQKMLKKL